MKRMILASVSAIAAFLILMPLFGDRVRYREDAPHYVVCTGAYTEIVSRSQFEALAVCNAVCSAYEVDVDGLVEIDWELIDGEIHVLKR